MFRRIGGPYAITWWTLLLPGAMWPVIAWTDPQLGGSLLMWLGVGGAALLAAAAVLLVARLTVLPCRERPLRPWLALAVFGAAGAVHGAVSSAVLLELGIEGDIAPARILLRAALATLWMAVIAIAVDESRRHRVVMRDLSLRLAELREVERIERERFDAVARELRADAVAPVLAALERIRVALAAADGTGEREVALRLGDVIATQVRPLSHALLDVVPAWSPPAVADAPVPWRRRAGRVIDSAASRPVQHPWVAALVYEATVTPLLAISALPGLVVALNPVVGTLILGGVATLGNRLLADRVRPHRAAVRLLVCVLVGVTAILIGNAAFALLTAALAGGALFYPATFATFPILVLLINVATGVGEDRRAEEQRLAEASERLEWATARIAQRVRHERLVLGSWLHGPTQSALLAVAARIERADDASRSAAITAALPDLAAAIASVQDLVNGTSRPPLRDPDAIGELVRVWRGVLEVDVDAGPGVAAILEADAGAHAAVVDLLAEALANAVRHGGAGTARVRITALDDPDRLRLSVVDDGLLAADLEPGMGSRLFDALAVRWEIVTREDGWTELTADVPFLPVGAVAQGRGVVDAML